MKIQSLLLTRAVNVSAAWALRRWIGTTRFHFRFADPMLNPEMARRAERRYIYSVYHETLLFGATIWAFPEIQILISDSRDGELSARILRRLGFGVIRGSTTRGGARAIREMKQRVDQGHLCLTPDGPRGPRRRVQQGLPYLASRTGLPIVAMGMAFKNPWRLRSWDRFAFPKPFQPGACVVPKPIEVPPGIDREGLEFYRREVEQRMQAATEEAEEWVERL